MGRPFKSSLFGKEAGFEALQKHFEISKIAIEKENIREKLRPVIAKAMREARDREDFKKRLKENRIGVIFRKNEAGRIYGVTFMDYQNRVALNGSRLGKEFSANVFNDLFNNPNRQVQINNSSKQSESGYQSHNQDLFSGSVFGLLDIPQPDNGEYEENAFANRVQNETKKRNAKAKRKGRRM